jgi:hypothetical protein
MGYWGDLVLARSDRPLSELTPFLARPGCCDGDDDCLTMCADRSGGWQTAQVCHYRPGDDWSRGGVPGGAVLHRAQGVVPGGGKPGRRTRRRGTGGYCRRIPHGTPLPIPLSVPGVRGQPIQLRGPAYASGNLAANNRPRVTPGAVSRMADG